MKNIVYLLTISILLTLGISACGNQLTKMDIQLENNGETYETGDFSRYRVLLTDENGNPASAEEVSIYINMERMNHPMEGIMNETKTGTYEIDLPLAMEGEWYIIVNAYIGKEEREEKFTVYGKGEMVMEYMQGFNADEKAD